MMRFDEEANAVKKQPVNALDADLDTDQDAELDIEMKQALLNFKSSVHAWSDAIYARPRAVNREARVRSWRPALGWALGCAVVAGSLSGGLLERHHRQEVARVAAEQRAAESEKQLRQKQAAMVPDEDLLADVDSDVSRQVPSAMEPLAQMMDETR
jgi:hypothetical protein